MKKAVLITAVTGSGKTTISKALRDAGYVSYDIESIDGLFQWVDDKTGVVIENYQDSLEVAQNASWTCDVKKLRELLDQQHEGLTFYCGAAGNIDEIWGLFDQVVILCVSNETTIQRLKSRDPNEYGKFGQTKEVRDWVLSWKHEVEQEWLEKGATPISNEGKPIDTCRDIIEATL